MEDSPVHIYRRLLGIDDVGLQAVYSLHFGATYHHHPKAGTWKQYVPPKRWLTFRHRASSIKDRRFATPQRTLFIYLINKYIHYIFLTVHH